LTDQAQDTAEDMEKRLAEWQQGDFALECGEFVFRDLPTVDEDGEDEGDIVLDSNIDGFVVVSQTCDIVRDPDILPYVSVCPLVKFDVGKVNDLEKGLVPRYFLLPNAGMGVAVDFSRIMSVSKSLLLTWQRELGCAGERDQLEFARALERFFGRFAFPDSFNNSLRSLRKAIYGKYGKTSDFGSVLKSIRELRVLPHASWSETTSIPITFIIVLDDEDIRLVKDRGTIGSAVKSKIDAIKFEAPFCLHKDAVYLASLSDLTAAEYLNSYPLDLNSLSFARKYR
jgi:hypothetical protein